MSAVEVSSCVRSEVERIDNQSRRAALEKLLIRPYEREHEWEYGAAEARIVGWNVAADVETGLQFVYASEGFGPAYPWGVIREKDSSAGRDDQWFLSLDDAFINSGLWRGGMPPDYEGK